MPLGLFVAALALLPLGLFVAALALLPFVEGTSVNAPCVASLPLKIRNKHLGHRSITREGDNEVAGASEPSVDILAQKGLHAVLRKAARVNHSRRRIGHKGNIVT